MNACGMEAAAATAVVMAPTMARPMPEEVKVFTADHPFLFVIRHNSTGAILFVGRLAAPEGGTVEKSDAGPAQKP